MITEYFIHLAILVGIYMILALSLQINIGFSGMLNLGHVAFFGIGAYISALLNMAGVPYIIALILAGIGALIFGFILSIAIRKLKGDYLALATMGFTFVIYAVLLNWTNLTRGPLGIPGIPKPEFFGLEISTNLIYLIFVAVILFITWYVMHRTTKSPFGRLLEATRDDELAAKSLGKNTNRIKAYSIMLAAFFAGIAGSLYAHYITYIDPSSFTLMQIIPIIAIVIVGGLASLKGTMIAAVIMILLPEPLRFIGFPSSIVGPARQMLYAIILILILLYRPKGFFGRVELE